MSMDLLTYLSKKLDENLELIGTDLAMGKPADLAAYKYAAGTYRGLLMAKNIIMETNERMKEEDDD